MENYRHIKLLIKFVFKSAAAALLLWPFFVFAYSTVTHEALTKETIDFFNSNFSYPDFNEEEKTALEKGSIDEDDGSRAMHHFYDPIYNRGLIFPAEWQKSKDWAKDTLAQASYSFNFVSNPISSVSYGTVKGFFSSETDHSWDRAVYEYAWGDKKRGLESLGHVLHLIQDASVPDHTRNDPHPPYFDELLAQASPYEGWTKKFNKENIDIFSKLRNERPSILSSLEDYFDNLALYSNGNFFSEDTISNTEYQSPEVYLTRDGFLFHQNYKTAFIEREKKLDDPNLSIVEKYTLKDSENEVLLTYWSRLSKQAVLHGAGVIKLFFDEVEKEKETKVLYNKNKSLFQKVFDATKNSIFNIAAVFYGSSVTPVDPEDDLAVRPPSEKTAVVAVMEVRPPDDLAVEPPSASAAQLVADEIPEVSFPEIPATKPAPVQNQFGLIAIPASASGAGGSLARDIAPPSPPAISSPANFSATFVQDTITFLGTAEVGSIISQSFNSSTTAASESGFWSLTLSLGQGTTTIQFFATDSAGNKSEALEISARVDSIAPDLNFSIAECSNSLSSDGCLATSTTATLSWSSAASDIASYELSCAIGSATCAGFPKNFSATSSVETTELLNNYTSYTFTVKAMDIAGNQVQSQQAIEIASRPVVINEIAWMGTSGNSADEWIELYNPTSKSVAFNSADNWVLRSTSDESPFIRLAGAIPAGGYYLIERKNTGETNELTEGPIRDITADLWTSFGAGLNNSGENLVLSRASSTVDEALQCGPNWCAGSGISDRTMERYNPLASSLLNWGTNNTFFKNGLNVSGSPIIGTPKSKNSVSYEITNSTALNTNKTLTSAKSPYLITNNGFTIASGVTLTIEPGVVIKLVDQNEPSLVVNGTIIANGTASNPVVFTAFKDDSYGGDMNGDGICNPSDASSTAACPQAGLWLQIFVNSSSRNSSFSNTIIRYGGRWFSGDAYKSAVALDNVNVSFDAVTVEYSKKHGIHLQVSSSTVSNSIFRNNGDSTDNTDAAGIYIAAGSPTISGNTFTNNRYGLYVDGAPQATLSSNVFSNNAVSAVESRNNIASYSSNSGSGNGLNGIVVVGDLGTAGTTTLKANSLPYILKQDVRIMSGAVLSFEPQVVVKGHVATNNYEGRLTVRNGGKLFFDGANASDLIFTSLYDDSVGGNSDNAVNTPSAGDWYGIFVDNGGTLDMKGFTLRYGGGMAGGDGTDKAGIRVEGDIARIDTALIENNYQNGIRLASSVDFFSIKNTTVRNHTLKTSEVAAGIRVIGTDGTLENMTFSGNEKDIKASSGYSIDMTNCNCGTPTTDPNPL